MLRVANLLSNVAASQCAATRGVALAEHGRLREVHDAFDAWRRADAAAGEAEKQVRDAAMQALDGKGPPPSEELLRRMHELRARADALLTAAMKTMNRERRNGRNGPIDDGKPQSGKK